MRCQLSYKTIDIYNYLEVSYGCPWVSLGWVCAQPTLDLIRLGGEESNPPLIGKEIGFGWIE